VSYWKLLKYRQGCGSGFNEFMDKAGNRKVGHSKNYGYQYFYFF
jgi:hypothetical protein